MTSFLLWTLVSHVAWHLALSPIIVVHAMVGKHFSFFLFPRFFLEFLWGLEKVKITFFFNALLISSILGSPELLVPRRDRGLRSTSPVARCFFCVFLQEFERKNNKKACFPFSHVAIFSSRCDFWRLLATFGETTTLTW